MAGFTVCMDDVGSLVWKVGVWGRERLNFEGLYMKERGGLYRRGWVEGWWWGQSWEGGKVGWWLRGGRREVLRSMAQSIYSFRGLTDALHRQVRAEDLGVWPALLSAQEWLERSRMVLSTQVWLECLGVMVLSAGLWFWKCYLWGVCFDLFYGEPPGHGLRKSRGSKLGCLQGRNVSPRNQMCSIDSHSSSQLWSLGIVLCSAVLSSRLILLHSSLKIFPSFLLCFHSLSVVFFLAFFPSSFCSAYCY